jgi:hypothetical protein
MKDQRNTEKSPFKEEWLSEDDRQRYLKPKKYIVDGNRLYDIDWMALYQIKKKTGMSYRELAEFTKTKVSPQWVCIKMNEIEDSLST